MAWNYSRYIGYVAAQGKKEYPLPMYVNTWLVQPNDIGAGDYPSGGPEPFVHDIWRAGGPAIDILAPDIYLPDYEGIIKTYSRNGNPAESGNRTERQQRLDGVHATETPLLLAVRR